MNYRDSIGTPDSSWYKARSWYVGTSKAEALYNLFLAERAKNYAFIENLCVELDADVTKIYLDRGYIRGFTPNDINNVSLALRPHFVEIQGLYILNLGSKLGREVSHKLHTNIPGPVDPDLIDVIGGVQRGAGTVVVGKGGTVPVLLLDSDDIKVDTSLWQKLDKSELSTSMENNTGN